MAASLTIPTLAEVEKAIGLEVPKWAGQCFGIACAVSDAYPELGGTALYGHYHGDICHGSIFYGRGGIVQHGWIQLPDGSVLDPTRWAFDSPDKPYLYHSTRDDDLAGQFVCMDCELTEDEHGRDLDDCGHFRPGVDRSVEDYDEGGNRYRADNIRPFPAFNGAREVEGFEPPLTDMVQAMKGEQEIWSVEQLQWLSNLPYDVVSGPTLLYIKNNYSLGCAFVPVDNMRRAEREA